MHGGECGRAVGDDEIGRESDKLRRVAPKPRHVAGGPAELDGEILSFDPALLVEALPQGGDAIPPFRVGLAHRHQHADAPHFFGLLRARCDRPCRNGAAGKPDELPPLHSITSSALASSVVGTAMPSASAVLRLITNWYLVGACTGRSAGFSPLSMRST